MFSHYKGLLLTGSTRTTNQKSKPQEYEAQRIRTEVAAAAVYAALKESRKKYHRHSAFSSKDYYEDQPPSYHDSDEDEDLDQYFPNHIEAGQEIDETYSPEQENLKKIKKQKEKEVVKKAVEPPRGPWQRSKPVPIRQLPKMLYPFGIEETNVYIGSYRNLNQFDLLKHELYDILTAGYTNIFVDIKAKAKKMTRTELCVELIPILLQDGNLFFFDVETTTLMSEDDLADFLANFCIKEGDEVVDRKSVLEEKCYTDLCAIYPIKYFPSGKSKGFDMGYPLEPEEPPVESHRYYNYVHALFDAKKQALAHNIMNIENELNQGSDMSMVSINRLIRFFSDDFNFLPKSKTDSEESSGSYWPSSSPEPEPSPSPKTNPALFSYICEEPNISL